MMARLVSFADLAPQIRHFVFEVPEVAVLDFAPGQFASLRGTIGGKVITRAYSLAAGPRGGNRFEICLNLVADGVFSPFLFGMAPGDEVECHGILGTFGWREPEGDVVLVATGTGVVPFRAMLELPPARPVTLIHGARYEESLLWRVEFESRPGLRYVPAITRPGPGWSGRQGRVQPLLEEALDTAASPQVYVCGLREMVDSVRAICKGRGLDRRRIVSEKYD